MKEDPAPLAGFFFGVCKMMNKAASFIINITNLARAARLAVAAPISDAQSTAPPLFGVPPPPSKHVEREPPRRYYYYRDECCEAKAFD